MKAPFPYFGGKRAVADIVWRALGDVAHYFEPFCGSCAVLLLRPAWHQARIESVVDADGHIANVWRALQAEPDAVAKVCDWPVNHADLIARKKRLNEENGRLLEALCKDDSYYDVRLAGYYIWAASCWIGHGLIYANQRPHLTHAGKGVHKSGIRQPGTFQDVREPYNLSLYEWFRELSERLRYVRVVCGDWSRVCGGNWQDNQGTAGIFFDPPYSDVAERFSGCYAVDSESVAHDVRQWCEERGQSETHRIVLAGYYDEHKSLLDEGWSVHRWSAAGGYAMLGNGKSADNRHKESLFFSPHCLPLDSQGMLFDLAAEEGEIV